MARRRQTHVRSSTNFRVRWVEVILTLAVMGLTAALTFVVLEQLSDETPTYPPDTTAPHCTDAIADAEGICYGEPLEPCITEDQVEPDCYWDSSVRGNGTGWNFIVLDRTVYYVGHSTNGGK